MKNATMGIVPAPGLPATICDKINEEISSILEEEIPDDVDWNIEIEIDRLTGAANSSKDIMDQAIRLKESNEWDYVISLTDLPIFYSEFIVLSDIDSEENVGLISLPAFGSMPLPNKIKNTMIHIVKEFYYRKANNKEGIQFLNKGIGINEPKENKKYFGTLTKVFKLSTIERIELQEKHGGVNVRFIIRPKLSGRLKVLSGMTVANRPWSIIPSFKKVIGLAFATGSYMLIFNTLWELSGIYNLARFIALMLLAMLGMVVWIVFAHSLWERKNENYSSEKLRLLYNATTVATLSVSVVIFYTSLFMLFLFAVAVFVPKDSFNNVLEHQVGIIDYFKLAWLVTSAATVAGAIGAGLENEDDIKRNAYGYRQYTRSKELEAREEAKAKDEKSQQQDKTNND